MHLALSCVTVSVKALSADPSQLSSFATVLSTEIWQVSQVTDASSVQSEPALVQALSPPTAQVPVSVAVSVVVPGAGHTHVPPVQVPTFASVGIAWQVVAPAATVPKFRLPPGGLVSLTVIFFIIIRPPPRSPLFPYTPLFLSCVTVSVKALSAVPSQLSSFA